MTRAGLLTASLTVGIAQMALCATLLVRTIRAAVVRTGRGLRARLFFSILGIVIGAWFFTYGALSLLLGI